MYVKGTVRLISIDPPCKEGNAQFTTVPFKALPDQYESDIKVYNF